jgi:hypothetical protein
MRLCASINPGVEPVYVDVAPEPSARPQECFLNVRRKIELSGGRSQFGWAIWQCSSFFIEAEHHAAYQSTGGGGSLVDITPQVPATPKIFFLPDDSAIHDPNTTMPTDNRRMALINDPRLDRILFLFADRTKLLNMVPHEGKKSVATQRRPPQLFAVDGQTHKCEIHV